MDFEDKNCRSCRGCTLVDCLDIDIETEVQCVLEQGVFEEALRETLNLDSLLTSLKESGYIKKSVEIKDIDTDSLIIDLVDDISTGIWNFLLGRMKDIKPEVKFKHVKSSEFSCSGWR